MLKVLKSVEYYRIYDRQIQLEVKSIYVSEITFVAIRIESSNRTS